MSQTRPDRETPPNMPRWVKIFGIILIVLVLTVAALHLAGINFGQLHHLP